MKAFVTLQIESTMPLLSQKSPSRDMSLPARVCRCQIVGKHHAEALDVRMQASSERLSVAIAVSQPSYRHAHSCG